LKQSRSLPTLAKLHSRFGKNPVKPWKKLQQNNSQPACRCFKTVQAYNDFNQQKMIGETPSAKREGNLLSIFQMNLMTIFKSVDVGIYFDDYVYNRS
jgi:hypothetical protein